MKHLWLILLITPLLGQTSYKCQYDGNELKNTFQSKYEGIKKAYLFKGVLCNHQYWIVESDDMFSTNSDKSDLNKLLDNLPTILNNIENTNSIESNKNRYEDSMRLQERSSKMTEDERIELYAKDRQKKLENMTEEERLEFYKNEKAEIGRVEHQKNIEQRSSSLFLVFGGIVATILLLSL